MAGKDVFEEVLSPISALFVKFFADKEYQILNLAGGVLWIRLIQSNFYTPVLASAKTGGIRGDRK